MGALRGMQGTIHTYEVERYLGGLVPWYYMGGLPCSVSCRLGGHDCHLLRLTDQTGWRLLPGEYNRKSFLQTFITSVESAKKKRGNWGFSAPGQGDGGDP